MGRPKKLKDITQTDGKANNVNLLTLDGIFGRGHCKYQTHDSGEYKEYLKGLDLVDLQKEGLNVANLTPIDNRPLLQERLLNEFNQYHNCLKAAHIKAVVPKETKELRAILNEGANKLR